jgi:polyisoprenoid-binding protein YceI
MRAVKSLFPVFFALVSLWSSVAMAAAPPKLQPGRYEAVVSRSRVAAFVRTTLHDFETLAPEFSGELVFPKAGGVKKARLALRFKTGSMTTDNSMRDWVMRDDVLEVAEFPLAVFRSKGVAFLGGKKGAYRFRVRGDFSIHGVTREISALVRLSVKAGEIIAESVFPIRRSDYKIEAPSPLPFLRTEDVVEIRVKIVFRRKN